MRKLDWIVVDSDSKDFVTVPASSQKEAVRKGVEAGCVPKWTNHARPRTANFEIMDVNEYREWFRNNFKT